MPLSPFCAALKRRGWRSALLCQLLASALTGSAAFAQTDAPAPDGAPAAEPGAPAEPGAAPGTTAPALRLTGFTFDAAVDLSETVSSNGRGAARAAPTTFGKRGADEITTARLDVGLHDHTDAFNGDLLYELSGYVLARNSQLDRISHNLAAIADAVLVPEHLELHTRAFARQIYVNLLGAIGADDRPVASGPDSGLRQAFGFSASPDFKFRMADFATSETTVFDRGVFFANPHGGNAVNLAGEDVPNSTNGYGATEVVSSGTDFTRVSWQLNGNAQKTERKAGGYSEASATTDLKFAVSHEFSLLATGGYESIGSEQKLTHDLRGPIWLVGFQYAPSPDLQLTARAGRQFNFPSYVGSLSYKLGPFTTLSGSLTDSVTTPAQRLLDNLDSLGVNDNGDFVDTQLGETSGLDAFDPAPEDALGLGNDISRYRSASLSLEHDIDRTQFRLTGFGTIRDRLTVSTTGIPPREESYGATLTITRQFTPDLTGDAEVSYLIHNVLGGRFNLARVSFEMNYNATMSTHLYLRASYLQRVSSTALVAASPLSGGLSDTVGTIGLHQDL